MQPVATILDSSILDTQIRLLAPTLWDLNRAKKDIQPKTKPHSRNKCQGR